MEDLSRADLLGRPAATWLADIFPAPSASASPGASAALALCAQLRAASVPRDAIEMLVVAWSSALDGLAPGASMPATRADALDRALEIQTAGLPVLADWARALRSRSDVAEDLDRIIQFLLRALTTWSQTAAMTAAAKDPVP